MADDSDNWIRRFGPVPDAAMRLICFPHAGGAASFYAPMSRAAKPEIDLRAVQYPGRQDRRKEPFLTSIDEIADRVAECLTNDADDRGTPLGLFGHSMGAMIAFEVAYRLERAGFPADAVFVSGRRAPSRHRDGEGLSGKPDEDVIDLLRRVNGIDIDSLDDDIVAMIVAVFRHDYLAVENYRFARPEPLRTPIVVFNGMSDPLTTMDEAEAWSAHTSAEFELRPLTGGHFFLAQHQNLILRVIADRLSTGVHV